MSLESILGAAISDTLGSKTTLRSVFKGRPILLDCWASWCNPCLEEMPPSKELAIDYKGKVDFVYLSFDRRQKDWLSKNHQLGLGEESYLLEDNFRSVFAEYFGIETIPRYLVFSSTGSLVTDNAPRPGKKQDLRRVLNSQLASTTNHDTKW